MLMGVTMSAFAGSGASRVDAVDLDLSGDPQFQDASSIWYRCDLSGLGDDAINVMISNQSGDDVHVVAAIFTSLEAEGAQSTHNLDLEVNQSKAVTVPAGLNKSFPTVYFYVTSNARIAIAGKAVKTEPGVGCKFPVELDFVEADRNWGAGAIVPADTAKTLRINGLETLKAIEPEPDPIYGSRVWGLKVIITNLGDETAKVTASLALTCGAPLQDISAEIPANSKPKEKVLKYSMVQQLQQDYVFVDVKSNQNIRITIEGDPQQAIHVGGADKAIDLPFDHVVTTQKAENANDSANANLLYKHWFRVDVKEGRSPATMLPNDSVLKIVYTNKSNSAITVSEKYVYGMTSNKSVSSKDGGVANAVMSEDTYKVPANGSASHSFSATQLKQFKADSAWYFIDMDKSGLVDIEFQLTAAEPGSICRSAIGYTLPDNTTDVISFNHKSSNAVWYKIDYQSALDTVAGAIKLTIKNNTSKSGTMAADIKFDCDGAATPQSKGISGGQSMSKTIGHALLDAYSGNGNHEIYVALTTDLDVTVSAQLVYEKVSNDFACMNATEVAVVAVSPKPEDNKFDFVAAGKDTAWYYINMDDLRIEGHERDLEVTLTCAGSVKIDAALSFSCPAGSMQEKSLSFSNTYKRTISYSQLKGMKNPYVRIIAAKSVHAELTPIAPKLEETNLCDGDTAVLEIKTDGSANNPLARSTWYRMDVEALRETLKVARVYVVLTSPSQKFSVGTLDTCYSKFALSYQTQTASGNGVSKREITADRLDLAGAAKELFVNVIADQAYSFKIQIDSIPEGSDCEHAEVFVPNKEYTQAAGETKWFKVKVADIRALGQNATMTLKNLDGTYTAMNAYVYTKCGGAELGSQKVGLAGNDIKVKTAGLAGYPDSVVLFVESKGNVSYRLDVVNETGETCDQAIMFDWNNGHVIAGGSEVWLNVMFKGNIDPNNGDSIVIHVDNLSVNDAKITAGAAYSCGQGVVQSGSRTVAGNSGMERDVTSMIGSRDSVLIRIAPDQAVRVWAEVVKMQELDEPITVCNGELLTYNKWYYVVADTPEQWFRLSIKDLQDNTIGDGRFRIQTEENANFKAEVSYVCPVLYSMTSKTLKVDGGKEYNRTITRADINSMTNDSVYIRVTTDRDARFQLEIQDLAGYTCDRAIEYEWATQFTNPAYATKWYKIPFVDILRDEHTGVKLNFYNPNEGPDSVSVRAIIWGSTCPIEENPENALKDSTLKVPEYFEKVAYLNHGRVEALAGDEATSLDTLFLTIYSEKDVMFSAVPYAEVEKLDSAVYCPAAEIDAFGKIYNVDDVMESDNKKLNNQIFLNQYPFKYGSNIESEMKIVYVDVDSTYIFDGNVYTMPEISVADLSILPIVIKHFDEEATLVTELVDVDIEDFIDTWNNGGDPENDIENLPLNLYDPDEAWVINSVNAANKTANVTLTLDNAANCENLVLTLDVPYGEDTETTIQVPSCVELLPIFDTTFFEGYAPDLYFVVNKINRQALNEGAVLKAEDLNLSVYPAVVNGVVAGLAQAQADAAAAMAAYNSQEPAPAITIVENLGWNMTGDTLRYVSSCGDTLEIANVPIQYADTNKMDTVTSALTTIDVVLCADEDASMYVDKTDTVVTDYLETPVAVFDQTYLIITGTATISGTHYNIIRLAAIENSGITVDSKVVVDTRVNPIAPDMTAAIAELTAKVMAWNANPANSIVKEEGIAYSCDTVNYTWAKVQLTDSCGSKLEIDVNVEVLKNDTTFNLTTVYACDPQDDVVNVTIEGFNVTVDTVRTVVFNKIADPALVLPDTVYYGELCDGTTTSTLSAIESQVDAFVAEWNAVEGNAEVTKTITTEGQNVVVALTDECGTPWSKKLEIKLYPVIENEPEVVSYVCAADLLPKNDTTVTTSTVDINGVTYCVKSTTIKVTIEKVHVAAGQLPTLTADGLVAKCGSPVSSIDYLAIQTAFEPVANALVTDTTVAALNFTWSVIVTDAKGNAVTQNLSGNDDIVVKCIVTDECNVKIAELETPAVKPQPRTYEAGDLTVALIKDYQGILVLDLYALKSIGIVGLKESEVKWYAVGNPIAVQDGGFYLTPSEKDGFEAFKQQTYYVVIDHLTTESDGCDTKITSQVVGTMIGAPMFIAPNAVNPGDIITIYNLDGQDAQIAVYDMMGNLVTSEQVSGAYNFSMPAQNNSGYYVVKVINGERIQSLKYVVK